MIHSKTRSSVGRLLHSPPPWGLETWDLVLDCTCIAYECVCDHTLLRSMPMGRWHFVPGPTQRSIACPDYIL